MFKVVKGPGCLDCEGIVGRIPCKVIPCEMFKRTDRKTAQFILYDTEE